MSDDQPEILPPEKHGSLAASERQLLPEFMRKKGVVVISTAFCGSAVVWCLSQFFQLRGIVNLVLSRLALLGVFLFGALFVLVLINATNWLHKRWITIAVCIFLAWSLVGLDWWAPKPKPQPSPTPIPAPKPPSRGPIAVLNFASIDHLTIRNGGDVSVSILDVTLANPLYGGQSLTIGLEVGAHKTETYKQGRKTRSILMGEKTFDSTYRRMLAIYGDCVLLAYFSPDDNFLQTMQKYHRGRGIPLSSFEAQATLHYTFGDEMNVRGIDFKVVGTAMLKEPCENVSTK